MDEQTGLSVSAGIGVAILIAILVSFSVICFVIAVGGNLLPL